MPHHPLCIRWSRRLSLKPACGKRRSRRKRLPAYSRDLVQLSLDVAQAKHTSQNEQANQRLIAQETAMDLQAMD